eukprot:7774537-Alexandrium_andersonii.AAC.1
MAEDGYLRASSWAGTRVCDLIVDGPARDPWVATSHGEAARGESTKTGSHQGVVFDTLFVRLWLAALVSELDPEDYVIGISPARFQRLWARALRDLG